MKTLTKDERLFIASRVEEILRRRSLYPEYILTFNMLDTVRREYLEKILYNIVFFPPEE